MLTLIRSLLTFAIILLPLLFGDQVFAQGQVQLTCDNIRDMSEGTINPNCPTGRDLPVLFAKFIQLALTTTIILCFFFIMFGGLRWIVSGGDEEKVKRARGTIVHAIIGLAIVFLSIPMMSFIGQILGFNFPAIPLQSLLMR